MCNHLDIGVERLDCFTRRLSFILTNTPGVVDNLPLQIAFFYDVSVNDADSTHSGSGEIIGCGRTQATGANQQYTRVEQLKLACFPYFGYQYMATIAFGLCLAHGAGLHKCVATGLPLAEAARHRNGMLVAHLF